MLSLLYHTWQPEFALKRSEALSDLIGSLTLTGATQSTHGFPLPLLTLYTQNVNQGKWCHGNLISQLHDAWPNPAVIIGSRCEATIIRGIGATEAPTSDR